MSRRLPSLHRPILALMGFLAGLGGYYVLIWTTTAILYVPLAIGLLAMWELTRRISEFARRRVLPKDWADDEIPPEDDTIHARRAVRSLRKSRPDMVVFALACVIGLGLAYLFWGPLPGLEPPRTSYGVVK
ncbi:hypothetical protein RPE78_08445 [Thioclava litoralis]|uniref:Transmembrane protein (PGPGW) n=1 Tax=Thioclava litoralis TaxID=3076557 RepID=A0ABZ1DW88_9RHOB|nr:hypothetical protein RPE78_08445 [Thioclava sp. FTW29]